MSRPTNLCRQRSTLAALLSFLTLWLVLGLCACGGSQKSGSVGDSPPFASDGSYGIGDGSSPLPDSLLARTGSAGAPPWNMFGKNSLRTRLSEHTGPPTNRLKWKCKVDSFVWYSSPAIAADGTIYIGDSGTSTTPGKLYAISALGKVKWTYAITMGGLDGPAVSADGSTIYVGGGKGYNKNRGAGSFDTKLYAISSSGSLRWTYDTGAAIQTSPVIGADGTIYMHSGNGNLYALNPDGTPKSGSWPFSPSGGVPFDQRSSPAIGYDGTLYFGNCVHDGVASGSGMFFAVNPDGTEQWSYAVGGFVTSSPAVGADGTVYVGSAGQEISNDNALYAFNADGTLKWRFATDQSVYSSPAIGADGALYVGSWGAGVQTELGKLYAINADGTLRWTYSEPTYGGVGFYSSPALGADGTIYILDRYGCMNAVKADGSSKWYTRDILHPNAFGSSPAIGADGTVYVGAYGRLPKISGPGLFAFGPGTP